MSRYYEIVVTAQQDSMSEISTLQTWTSFPDGKSDPGALNVQLDLLAYPGATPMGNSTVSIEGISLADLLQPQQYAGQLIFVRGGMKAGLPLANPAQSGLLIKGTIYQAFGNWVGTDMNLNFVIVPGAYTFANPANLVFHWQPGTSLNTAIETMLSVAYPGVPLVINIGAQYATTQPVTHVAHTLSMFAQWLKQFTASASSPGVDIMILNSGAILVADGSVKTPAVQLAFNDLIGQPKWVDQNTMQFTTVMRADVQVGSFVRMPVGMQNAPGFVQTGAASLPSSLRYKTAFQGLFVIQSVRHVGNFRDADGTAWASIFQAAAVNV